jgi:hypothetical protein
MGCIFGAERELPKAYGPIRGMWVAQADRNRRQLSSEYAERLISVWLSVKVPERQPDRLVEIVLVQITQAHGFSSSPGFSPRICTSRTFC